MSELARENLKKAQVKQKVWYDRKARDRAFQAEDKVLVLLPSTTHKLTAEWQDPYEVKRLVGQVDYEVHMGGQKGKTKIFRVNMLKRWREASDTSFLVGCVN